MNNTTRSLIAVSRRCTHAVAAACMDAWESDYCKPRLRRAAKRATARAVRRSERFAVEAALAE